MAHDWVLTEGGHEWGGVAALSHIALAQAIPMNFPANPGKASRRNLVA